MRSKFKLMVLVAAALSVAGCGQTVIRNHSNDYLGAEEIPAMAIPDDKDQTAVGQLYPVPEIAQIGADPDTFEAPRPQPATDNAAATSTINLNFDLICRTPILFTNYLTQ